MAPKKEKQSLKKPSSYMKSQSALSEKFKPMYYASDSHGSSSSYIPPVLKHPSSPAWEEGNSLDSLPFVEDSIPINSSTFDTLSIHKSICVLQAKCRDLERMLEIANFPKGDISQASFSPLEKCEKKPFTPLVNEKKIK